MDKAPNIHGKSGLDSSGLQKARDQRKQSYRELIKYAHQRLVEEGRSANYVMTNQDAATALGIDKSRLSVKLQQTFGTGDLQTLLAGLNLPNNYKEEY